MLDCFNLEISGNSTENIKLINQSAELLFRKKSGIDKLLPQSADLYQSCPMLQIYTSIMYFFSFSAKTIDETFPIYLLRIKQSKLNLREEFHYQALLAISNQDLVKARDCYIKLVEQFPADKVAILMIETCGFLSGKIDALFLAYEGLYPYQLEDPDFLGMYAFLLTHNNQLVKARTYVKKALELDPTNAWVQHVYAHTIDETNALEIKHGIDFLNACINDWPKQSRFFEGHNWMHLCGLYLTQDNCKIDKILSIYSKHIWGEAREYSFEQNNAFWVLWQLRLNGYSKQIPEEIRSNLAFYAKPYMTDYVTPYLTVTAILSVAQFDLTYAQIGVDALEKYIRTLNPGSYKYHAWQEIATPILYGCLDYLREDYKSAYHKLAPVINQTQAMGHSDEQRVIFSATLIATQKLMQNGVNLNHNLKF